MRKLAAMLSRIRIVTKRSSTLTKVVVLCAIVLSMATLLTLRTSILNAQAQTAALKDKASQLEQENEQLKDKIDSLGSVDSVDQIAQDELGLVPSDSVIFDSGE